MAHITVEQLKQSLVNNKFAPVYFIHGSEPYLIDQLTKAIIAAAVESGTEDFNLNVLYGNEVDGGEIVNAVTAYPMMAYRRVVVVKNFHLLARRDMVMVEKYVQKPAVSTCFLMTCEKVQPKRSSAKNTVEVKSGQASDSSNSKKSPIYAIMEHSTVIEVKPLYDSQIPQWITTTLSERGFAIADDALRIMHAYSGTSLADIQSEIDKIILNLGAKKNIELTDVESIIGVHRQFNIFELCDAVGSRNIKKSYFILNQMLQLGELPTGIVAMIVRHFTILAKIKELRARKMSNNDIAKSVKLNSFFVNNYIQQAASFSMDQLGAIFAHLLESDEHLKTSYQKPKLVLEILFLKIMTV